MRTIDNYETDDGKIFDSLEGARNHERAIYLQSRLGYPEDIAESIVQNRDDVLAILKWRGRAGTNPWTPRKRREKIDAETGDLTTESDDGDDDSDDASDDVGSGAVQVAAAE